LRGKIRNVPKKSELEIAKQQVTIMGTPIKTKENPWKEKARSRSRLNNRLKTENKRQHERAEKWKKRYYELKESTNTTTVKNHHYPLELMWMAVWMSIHFNVSLRGVSKSLCKFGELYGLSIDYISPTTIRNWCLKFGLYCLLQPIKKGNYVLILDESVEIGKEHLMVLLVVRTDQSSPISALRFEDVKVLDIRVQSSWKSTEVEAMIKKQKKKHGIDFSYGISDKDSMLRKALTNCDLKWVGDCTHEMANQTKALFRNDDEFNGFIKQLNALRAKWIMSKNNFHVPPGLRSKSRFHQLFIVHKWGQFILNDWENIPETAKEELMFVKQSEDLIKKMTDFHYLIESFAKIFKTKGIQDNSTKQWKKLVVEYRKKRNNELAEQVEQFIRRMNQYLEVQKLNFDSNFQILCCSDIIESTFGKYKNKGGAKIITDDVLKIAAYPHKKDLVDVKIAMENIKIIDLLEWKNKNTVLSKLALLKRKKKKNAA